MFSLLRRDERALYSSSSFMPSPHHAAFLDLFMLRLDTADVDLIFRIIHLALAVVVVGYDDGGGDGGADDDDDDDGDDARDDDDDDGE